MNLRIALIIPIAFCFSACATKRFGPDELHVVGVYEGGLPAGADDRPWWARCGDLSPERCHSVHAGQHAERTVTIGVGRIRNPVVLVLTSYEPELWVLHVVPGTK